jgi:glyoxylase-like metal-dependent hydrolase (beta-lactamase superfamily II)
MIFRQLFDATSSTYTYLLASRRGGEALIIDPVLERVERYLKLIEELDLKLVKAVDTHLHADHITGLGALRDHTKCITVMGEQSNVDVVSMRIADGDRLDIEGLSLGVIYTPGHTDDSYCFTMADRVFTGDTLLIRGTGRTDFQNGSARAQYESIFNRLLRLPDETLVYPAHDYKGDSVSTVAEERAHNPRLKVRSVEEYEALMAGLKLANPQQIDLLRKSAANRVLGLGLTPPAFVRCSDQAEPRFDVDQSGDDGGFGGMGVARVTEALGHDAEPLGPADAVLDGDAEAAQAAVVVLLVGAQIASSALLVGKLHRRVLPLVALVGAVGVEACRARQLRPFAADGEVVAAARMRVRDAGDAPLGGDDVFGLQRVALALARVVRPLRRILARALDRLLGAVHDQRLSLAPRDLRVAPDAEQRPSMRLDAPDRPADHAAIHLPEEADELLGDVAAVIQQHDQQVFLQAAGLSGISCVSGHDGKEGAPPWPDGKTL